MTAILQLPLVRLAVDTQANEDWRDGIAYGTAGDADWYAAPINSGNGTLSGVGVTSGAWLGDYQITLTGPNTFQVADPTGLLLGMGFVARAWSRSGVSFTVVAGDAPFIPGDTFVVTVLPTPIDLTGISFEMDVRVGVSSTSYLYASTDNGLLANSGRDGVLGFAVPGAKMLPLPPGALVADILAHGDGVTRCCATLAITHSRGVTAPR